MRAIVWNSKRESRFPIHADVWKGPDANEGRANLCVYESKETGKNPKKEGDNPHYFSLFS